MKSQTKKQAVILRKQGHSLKDISVILSVSKSTCSLWLRNVTLSYKARERLEAHCRRGVLRGAAVRHEKSTFIKTKIQQRVSDNFTTITWSKECKKLACALLYWAE